MTEQQTEIDYSYENFIGSHVRTIKPKGKSFEVEKGKKQCYNEVPILYNYGTPEAPIIDGCFIELPPVTCKGGIVSKKETKPSLTPGEPPYIKETHSMMIIFNLQDQDNQVCLKKFDEFHMGAAEAFAEHKGDCGMFNFDPKNPGDSFKCPVYYKQNPKTGKREEGQNPSMWVKLNHWKNNKTLFTALPVGDEKPEPIDWSLLYDVDIKFVPLVQAHHIYAGSGKAVIQMKLVSAIILDIVKANTSSKQGTTMNKLKEKYAGLANQVASQLAQVRMERQDELDTATPGRVNATLPSNGGDDGEMHSLSGGNGQGGDQLNDFLGGNNQNNQPRQSTYVQRQTSVPQVVPQMQQQVVPQMQQQVVPQMQQGYGVDQYQTPIQQQYQQPQQVPPQQYQVPVQLGQQQVPQNVQQYQQLQVPGQIQLNARPVQLVPSGGQAVLQIQ